MSVKANPTWTDPAEFYADDRRRDSVEHDLGTWLFEQQQPPLRLVYFDATGDLALLREEGPPDRWYVELVGWYPDRVTLHKGLDKTIAGWKNRPKGVYELRKKVGSTGVRGADVDEQHRRAVHARQRGAVSQTDQQGLF